MKNNLGESWTTQEDQVLVDHYGSITSLEIHKRGLLPNRTLNALRLRAANLGLKSRLRKITHTFDETFWRTPTLSSAYWGGNLAADGALIKRSNRINTMTLQLTVSVKDKEHLKHFKGATGYSGPIRYYWGDCKLSKPGKMFQACYIRINQMWKCEDDLRDNFGIVENKTYRLASPRLDTNLLKLAFIIGFIDGDGAITASYRQGSPEIEITSSSVKILDWIKTIFDELFFISCRQIRGSEVQPRHEGRMHAYRVSGFRACKIIAILSHIPTYKMGRKWQNPTIWAMIDSHKMRYPEEWAIRLPIEDEIDALLAATPTPHISSV